MFSRMTDNKYCRKRNLTSEIVIEILFNIIGERSNFNFVLF